jgi:hypothetical protein
MRREDKGTNQTIPDWRRRVGAAKFKYYGQITSGDDDDDDDLQPVRDNLRDGPE